MDAHAVRICVSITARICRPEASFVPVDLDINPTRRTRTTVMVCGVVWILYSLENLYIYFFIGRQAYSGAPKPNRTTGTFMTLHSTKTTMHHYYISVITHVQHFPVSVFNPIKSLGAQSERLRHVHEVFSVRLSHQSNYQRIIWLHVNVASDAKFISYTTNSIHL